MSCLLLVFVATLGACAPDGEALQQGSLHDGRMDSADRPVMAIGMTLDELRAALDIPVKHQFTVRSNGQDVVCVSSTLNRYRKQFYFVFVDDKLGKLIDPPPFNLEIRRVDNSRIAKRIVNPTDRVRTVLDGDGISIEDAVVLAQSAERARKKALERYSEPLPIPLFLWELREAVDVNRAARDEVDYLKYAELEKKYDGLRIQLDMEPSIVSTEFGSPTVTKPLGTDGYVAIHGEDADVGKWKWFVPWVAVKFNREKVATVYSRDFFDRRLLDD